VQVDAAVESVMLEVRESLGLHRARGGTHVTENTKFRFFETSCSLQATRQVNGVVRPGRDDIVIDESMNT
jgi:hypothetical protein